MIGKDFGNLEFQSNVASLVYDTAIETSLNANEMMIIISVDQRSLNETVFCDQRRGLGFLNNTKGLKSR